MIAGAGEHRVGAELTSVQRGDSLSVPDEVEDGSVNGRMAFAGRTCGAEALKKAARDGVSSRWERIEDRCLVGCVDWYQYSDEPN